MESMQEEGEVGADGVEDSMNAVFSSVSNLFTNEVANVKNGMGKSVTICFFFRKPSSCYFCIATLYRMKLDTQIF